MTQPNQKMNESDVTDVHMGSNPAAAELLPLSCTTVDSDCV